MSPLNLSKVFSTTSRVMCFHGATRTTAPSLSNESVSQPNKAVVRYSYNLAPQLDFFGLIMTGTHLHAV